MDDKERNTYEEQNDELKGQLKESERELQETKIDLDKAETRNSEFYNALDSLSDDINRHMRNI